MTDNWDDVSYIQRSKYRRDVVRTLAAGSATPSDIAHAHAYAQPHVSRALNELRDRDLVELLVPEDQARGRYYGLTDDGRAAWENLSEALIPTVLTHRDPTETEADLLSLFRDRTDGALRALARSENDRVAFLHERSDVAERLQGDRDERLASLFTLGSHDDAERLDYEVLGTGDLTLIRLYPGDDGHLAASFDPDGAARLSDLAEDALALF